MDKSFPPYSVAIRTLGRAGEKYQTLLNSLVEQTHKPQKIVVYLAEGYEKPKETVGIEQVVYVPKGMVAQRALSYNEIDSEWILFLDDDIEIVPDGVERLFSELLRKDADVIAVDAFPHDQLPLSRKVVMALLLSSIPRIGRKDRGYRVNILGTDVYNPKPSYKSAWSTTNSGMAFLARKNQFLEINFEKDSWLDESPIAYPEDKVMFYKMHLQGLKILTHYDAGFTHLDAGTSNLNSKSTEKIARSIYSGVRNNIIFNELYILPNLKKRELFLRRILVPYKNIIGFIYGFFKEFNNKTFKEARKQGRMDALSFLSSRKNII